MATSIVEQLGESKKDKFVVRTVASIRVTNALDKALASLGHMKSSKVRSVALDNVLVDTGATYLSLPADVIDDLGLEFERYIYTSTAQGEAKTRLFKFAELTVEGRTSVVECLELPGSNLPLLGYLAMELLFIEPDLQNQRLRLLQIEGPGTLVTA